MQHLGEEWQQQQDVVARECVEENLDQAVVGNNKRARTSSLVGMLLSLASSPKRKAHTDKTKVSVPPLTLHSSSSTSSTASSSSSISLSSSTSSSSTYSSSSSLSASSSTSRLSASRVQGSTRIILQQEQSIEGGAELDKKVSMDDEVDAGLNVDEDDDEDEEEQGEGEMEESCFICLGAFSQKHPPMHVPCANQCNKSPVHGKCIYEWSESRQSSKGTSCPLCRGPLNQVNYIPRDRIGSHRFSDFSIRRDFVVRPVPKSAGVVRCYVRALRQGYLGTATRYELYLQAPTTLKYPLGPLPSVHETRPGDVLLAVSHKHVNRWGCTQLDITMDPSGRDFSIDGQNYLGCLYSSFTGLEHTLVAAARESGNNQPDKTAIHELGAIRYTQNRIGRAVGPRRIHVCFPRIIKTLQVRDRSPPAVNLNSVVPFPASGDQTYTKGSSSSSSSITGHGGINLHQHLFGRRTDTSCTNGEDFEDFDTANVQTQRLESLWATVPNKPKRKQHSLSAVLRAASQAQAPPRSDEYMFGCNRSPYWLQTINAFSLDFGGRVTLPSNKNFQLIMNETGDKVALQFGKIAESDDVEVFTMDVAWPLSPLQAFGVCLSACDRKLLCA